MADVAAIARASAPPPAESPPQIASVFSRRETLLCWLSANPLVPSAAGLAMGIALDAMLAVPMPLALGLFALCGVGLGRRRTGPLAAYGTVALAAALVGTQLHDVAFRRWSADHLVQHCPSESVFTRVVGKVISTPLQRVGITGWWYSFGPTTRTRFWLDAERLGPRGGERGVSGKVAVLVREPLLTVRAGDRVELTGTLYRPGKPANLGGKNWALLQRRNGILVQMSCKRATNVTVFSSAADWRHRWMSTWRRRAQAAMLDDVYPREVPGAGLLAAMVLGQRSAVDEDLNEAFVRSGTVHYLSVSGAHVGMLASAIWLTGLLAGIPRRRTALAAMAAVIAYATLAESNPPILRAAIMTCVLCVGIVLRRPIRTANWLALSALIILAMQPTQLFNSGFQFSYATLIAVIYLAPVLHAAFVQAYRRLMGRDDPLLSPRIQDRLNPPGQWWRRTRWLLRWAGDGLAVGLAAGLAGGLLAAYHFERMQMWGWVNSLLVLPLVWLVMLLGLIKTALAAVVPAVTSLLGPPLAWLTECLIALVEQMAHMPAASVVMPHVSPWLVAFSLLLLSLWVAQPCLRLPKHVLPLLALVFVTTSAWALAPHRASDELRLHVLAVDNGTATVIELPNGKTLMYDVGCVPPYDLERWTLGPLLSERKIARIDAVLLSHANLDHYSGLEGLIRQRTVGRVISTPHFRHTSPPESASGRVITAVAQTGVPWDTTVRGNRLGGTGEVRVEVLWPPAEELPVQDSNDTSMVARVDYLGRRLLLCGDIEEYALQRLLQRADDIRADMLILPHHGSVQPSTGRFIEAVNPVYCLRSSGNHDAHTINGLLDLVAHRRYLNTADDGGIEVVISSRGVEVVSMLSRGQGEPPSP